MKNKHKTLYVQKCRILTSSLGLGLDSAVFLPELGEGFGEEDRLVELTALAAAPDAGLPAATTAAGITDVEEAFFMGNFRLAFLLMFERGLNKEST